MCTDAILCSKDHPNEEQQIKHIFQVCKRDQRENISGENNFHSKYTSRLFLSFRLYYMINISSVCLPRSYFGVISTFCFLIHHIQINHNISLVFPNLNSTNDFVFTPVKKYDYDDQVKPGTQMLDSENKNPVCM